MSVAKPRWLQPPVKLWDVRLWRGGTVQRIVVPGTNRRLAVSQAKAAVGWGAWRSASLILIRPLRRREVRP